MASADQFFRRLRERVAARTAAPAAPVDPVAAPAAPEATREQFFDELRRLGAVPHVTLRATAGERVLAIARESKSESFVAWRDGWVEELGISAQLIAGGLRHVESEARPALALADLVVSGCDLAFAENGALLLFAGARRGRLLTALPRVHVALVARSQLVYGLEALPEVLRRAGMPSAAVLHTGPTFSGDIEAIVVIGAHGPAALHVIWIDE